MSGTITVEVDMYLDEFGTPAQVPYRAVQADVLIDDVLVPVWLDVTDQDFGCHN